jgi:hypothetical protein
MTENKIPYELSFASHEKSKYWSDKNELKPCKVSIKSSKQFWFFCDKCKHTFLRPIYKINNIEHCTYCIIPSKLLCNNEKCKFCFERSFASYEKAKYWSSKNQLKPFQIFKNSAKKFIFDCDNCNHEIEITPQNINTGFWCSYCSNPPKKLCDNKNCKLCFEKSFASHKKAKYWSDKNKLNPN